MGLNLGLGIAVSVREREQGCFGGSSEGARGAVREQEGAGASLDWLLSARLPKLHLLLKVT